MTEPDEQVAAGAADEVLGPDVEQYRVFVEGLELAGVEVVRVFGERRLAGHAPQTRYSLGAGWQAERGSVVWRYDVGAHLTDEADADFGGVEASVIVSARTDSSVDPACAEQFGGTSGAFIAHPYLREAIASTALRLGFVGVLLPMLKDLNEVPADRDELPHG